MKLVFLTMCFVAITAMADEPIEPQPVKQDQAQEQKPKTEDIGNKWRLSLSLARTLSNEVEVGDYHAYQTTPYASLSGTGTIKYEETFVIGAFVSRLAKNQIGAIFGLNYYTNRSAKSLDFKYADGSTYSQSLNSGTASSLESYIIDLGATYRWNLIYSLIGLNHSRYKFTPASSSTGSSTATGAIGGYFIGAGVFFNDDEQVSAEIQYSTQFFKLTGSTSNVSQYFEDARMKAMSIALKYHF
jgi:hypothetical protein